MKEKLLICIFGIISLIIGAILLQAVGFGDPSPDTGTPDNGTFEAFGDGFSSIVNNFTFTQTDNNNYFAILRDNGLLDSLDLQAWLNLTYNITPLINLGMTPTNFSNFSFYINYCLNNDVDGNFSCGGTDTAGVSVNPHDVQLFNFSSGQFVDIGDYDLSDSSPNEFNATTQVLSGFRDYVSSQNLIIVRYEIDVTIVLVNDDAAFGVDYAPLTITYDLVVPQIKLIHPQNITYNTIQTSLNYTVSDETALGTCWYTTNGGAINTTITCGNNVTGLNSGQGSSTWTVYANDTVGNVNSSSVTFFVDSIAPQVTIFEPRNITYSTTSLEINFTASDTNLNSCWYTDNFGATNHTLTNCANTTYTASQGSTTIKVYANDTAGNSNSSSVTFFVNTSIIDSVDAGVGAGGGGKVREPAFLKCTQTNQCQEGFVCRENQCVRLFDIIIKEIEFPINANSFLDFKYFIKEINGISDDVIVEFFLKDFENNEIISKAGETIFVSEGEESSRNSFIFVPSYFKGLAILEVIVSYQDYSAKSFQTIEVNGQDTERNNLIIIIFILGSLIYLLHGPLKKLINDLNKINKNRIMIVDNKIINELKEKVHGMNLEDKWIAINPPEKPENKKIIPPDKLEDRLENKKIIPQEKPQEKPEEKPEEKPQEKPEEKTLEE